MFLSTHLHNPCLCRRGHDLSDDDNIMGLWLLGIHGQVVAHICKDIGVVVRMYVLIVAIRGGLFEGAVPRSPSYCESFRGGVVVTYVAVVLVFDYPFTFYRGGRNLYLALNLAHSGPWHIMNWLFDKKKRKKKEVIHQATLEVTSMCFTFNCFIIS